MSTDKHRLIPITDLHTAELEIYNERREVQLFHYYEPERGLFIAESPNVILRALAAGYEPLSPSDGTAGSGFGEGQGNPGADCRGVWGNSRICGIQCSAVGDFRF